MRKEIQGSLEFAKCLFCGLNCMFRLSASGVAFALLLSSQGISFGLIGETLDQCAVRYGVPTRHDENSIEYRLKNRVLVVTFVEGRAASIICSDAPSERGGAAVHFQEIPKFQEPQSIEFFSASSGARPFGFKNLANLPWDLLKFLWGKKEPSALYLGMWSTHLTDPDLDVQNNWLIGLNIEGFFVGTFINSYDKRSWAAGIERRVWSVGKKNGLNASLGYRLGLMTGYEERFTMFFGHSPIILFPELISNIAYKNVGFQIGYSWTVLTGGFFWRF